MVKNIAIFAKLKANIMYIEESVKKNVKKKLCLIIIIYVIFVMKQLQDIDKKTNVYKIAIKDMEEKIMDLLAKIVRKAVSFIKMKNV